VVWLGQPVLDIGDRASIFERMSAEYFSVFKGGASLL